MRLPSTALASLLLVACGAKSPLYSEASGHERAGDASASDAGFDVDDASQPLPDVALDAPVDSWLPPPDVAPLPGCEGDEAVIFVITANTELHQFAPRTLDFERVGVLDCPGNTSTPFSMGVARDGTAYSVFMDGNLWRIDTKTAACSPTPYQPDQQDWLRFGMGFSGEPLAEELFVSHSEPSSSSEGLGKVDVGSFELSIVGAYSSELARCELTGTGDGGLFAFCMNPDGQSSRILELDRATAATLNTFELAVKETPGFAFAHWGGQFWIFTSVVTGLTGTTVWRYDPSSDSVSEAAHFNQAVVGAGVSTCAPI